MPIIAEVHSISEDVRKNQEVIAKLEETKKKLEFELIRLGAKEVASAKNLEMVSKRMDKMKQRVHDISKKISELSGTPENYQKSISFKHTAYPEFNKKVKKLMNCKDSAPDSQDILEALVDCNKKFNYNLRTNHMKQIASMSFQKVSLKLRKRRELELKEDLSVFDTNEEDPAIVDAELLAKLNDNKRIGELNLIKL